MHSKLETSSRLVKPKRSTGRFYQTCKPQPGDCIMSAPLGLCGRRHVPTLTIPPGIIPAAGLGQMALVACPYTLTPDQGWEDAGKRLVYVRMLGEGANGIVHEVRDTSTGKIYAKKTINLYSTQQKRLKQEIRCLRIAQHPNIVKFYGAYFNHAFSEAIVLMEYCDGGSLEVIMSRSQGHFVSEVVLANISIGILSGLAYLHLRQIVHFDIKPANVLITRNGEIKICDFGVSCELRESSVVSPCGTLAYMPPEMVTTDLRRRNCSNKADIWSVGLTIVTLAQNRTFFTSDMGSLDIAIYIQNGTITRLSDEYTKAERSTKMRGFISLCLSSEPNDRPEAQDLLGHAWLLENKTPIWFEEIGWEEITQN